MIRFNYFVADNVADAIRAGRPDHAAFLAGGTNLVDLIKENVARPLELVDINQLPVREITELDGGGLRLGVLVTNSETAYDKRIQARYPMLASAILAGASPQLRNAATNGGNLNPRIRCYYYHATGKRVRSLPIIVGKLLAAPIGAGAPHGQAAIVA